MNESTKGETIHACFEFVSRCSQEVENLIGVAKTLLDEELERRSGSLPFTQGAWGYSGKQDDSDWLYIAGAWSLPLKRRGSGAHRAQAFLTLQVNLMGDGLPPGSCEPVLHVYAWDCAGDFRDYYLGFPIDMDQEFDVEKERRILYKDERTGEEREIVWRDQWSYSIRLTALQSPSDLIRLIVQPALSLLTGEPVEKALPDELFEHGLIRYPDKSALIQSR